MTHEDVEQIRIMDWARVMAYHHPEVGMLFHIANERQVSPKAGAWLKQKGVKAGVPDMCLPVARGDYHGMWIELKRADGGRVSEAQRDWIERLTDEGYKAIVCHGADEAIDAIKEYLQW